MIKLSNGAEVHAAYLVPSSPGLKPHGVVLAMTDTAWVTWLVYWDGLTIQEEASDFVEELWETESGIYFEKNILDATAPRRKARQSFGARVRRLMDQEMRDGFYNEEKDSRW